MLKKSLFAVALIAVLVVPAMAGAVKVHQWATICTYEKVLLDEIDVMLKMPFFIKIEQPSTINLAQMTDSMDDFTGVALLANGNKPKVTANFDAVLSTTIVPTADGITIQPTGSKWSSSVSPANITRLVTTEVTITATVMDVDLSKLAVCSNYKVAVVSLWVIPSGTPTCSPVTCQP